MSQINYQPTTLGNFGKKKGSSTKGMLGVAAAGLTQFGIGMANAWSKSNDEQKDKFPEWFKKLAGHESKDATAKLEDSIPMENQSMSLSPVEQTQSDGIDNMQTSQLPAISQPDSESDYAASWNDENHIDDVTQVHPVDLAGSN